MRTIAVLPDGTWQEVGRAGQVVTLVSVSDSAFCDLVSGHETIENVLADATVAHETATTVTALLECDSASFNPDLHLHCNCARVE